MVATKKKKKDKDFQKKKLKIGKKLQPSNHTNVSFKSHAVLVPTQNLTMRTDEKQEPTNSKNATLKELLSHSAHPNYNQRKEAVLGMKDLFQQHPDLLLDRISLLISSTLRLMLDQYQSVRRAYLSLITDQFIRVPADVLAPFFGQIMIYTCSGMTHIDENIRVDALKFLWFWFEQYPRLTVQHGSRKILPNFIGLLSSEQLSSNSNTNSSISGGVAISSSSSSSSSSSKNATGQVAAAKGLTVQVDGKLSLSGTRMEILQSVFRFLQLCMTNNGGTVAAVSKSDDLTDAKKRPLEIDISTTTNGAKFNLRLTDSWRSTAMPYQLFSTTSAASSDNPTNPSRSSAGANSAIIDPDLCKQILPEYDLANNPAHIQCYLNTLHPILIDIWLECFPNIFNSPSASAANQTKALEACRLTLRILCQLLLPVLRHRSQHEQQLSTIFFRKWLDSVLDPIVKHISPHFPFHLTGAAVGELHPKSGHHHPPARMIMMETSVLYSQLMLAFMAFKPSANWTGAVVDFLVDDVLTNGGFNTVPSSLSSVMDQLLSVLQTIIGLLPGERQRQVLHALFTVTASSSPSATGKQQKRAVCGFLCRLIDRHLGHWKDLAVFEKAGQEINRMASTFISMLPRQLWDMANDQQQHQQKQQSADNIVQFMHRIVTAAGALRCQQNAALHAILNAAHLSVDQLMETLQLAMVPLFQYYSAKQGRLFRGPISRLPVSTQRNLRSIIALMMPSVHPKLLQAIQPIDPIDANIIY